MHKKLNLSKQRRALRVANKTPMVLGIATVGSGKLVDFHVGTFDEEAKLVRLKTALEAEKEVILNYEEYLKLFRAMPVILGNVRYMKTMDELLRFFFLNFTIHPHNNTFRKGSKATCNIKEPWQGFLKRGIIVNGAPL